MAQLRDRSGTVIFEGTAEGITTAPAETRYFGNDVGVNDGATTPMTIDLLMSGAELLDRAVPAACTVLASGTYAFAATAGAQTPLTAGGCAILSIAVGDGSMQFSAQAPRPERLLTATGTANLLAGDPFIVVMENLDGAVARHYFLARLALVKLA